MRRVRAPRPSLRLAVVLACVLAIAAGCARHDTPSAASFDTAAERSLAVLPAASPLAAAEAAVSAAAPSEDAGTHPARPASGRMLVRNVALTLVVADVDSAARRVEALVAASGGFVSGSSVSERGGFPYRNYVLRLPGERLDGSLAALRSLAVRVAAESQNVEDVTAQAVDVAARLRTLRATETELIGLLEDARAQGRKVDDVMAIYRELTGIRTQIEQYEGRLESLRDLATLSTVTLQLVSDAATAPLHAEGWRPRETFANSLRQLTGALRGLGDFAIWAAIVLVPIGGVVAFALVGLVALVRRALPRWQPVKTP